MTWNVEHITFEDKQKKLKERERETEKERDNQTIQNFVI